MMSRVLIASALLCAVAHAAIPADEVTSIPTYSAPFKSKQYSGYLSADGGQKMLHYYLVESENNPSTDPVVFWFNGGPGCSSMGGFWTEHGPFRMQNAIGTPQVVENPNRWNRIVNMVYLEAPAGAGYSYATTEAAYTTNDTQTAEANLDAVVAFFKGFPEFLKNDFFISGESYAGIYVPMLAQQVLNFNKANSPQLNLKGIMVGNGCTGSEIGACGNMGDLYRWEMEKGHGLVSNALIAKVDQACGDFSNPSAECEALLQQVSEDLGVLDIYDYLAPCTTFDADGPQRWHAPVSDLHTRVGGLSGCFDNSDAVTTYSNNPDFREAIHVKSEAEIGRWLVCGEGKLNYITSMTNELKLVYPDLIRNIRILIYNGDSDLCVPYLDNEAWTTQFAQQENLDIVKGWHAWQTSANQVGGYLTKYTEDFSFITIKGSGHMVPEFTPEAAYDFFKMFISNTL